MIERLKKLYKQDKLNEKNLDNAITKGWITKEQKTEIMEA